MIINFYTKQDEKEFFEMCLLLNQLSKNNRKFERELTKLIENNENRHSMQKPILKPKFQYKIIE